MSFFVYQNSSDTVPIIVVLFFYFWLAPAIFDEFMLSLTHLPLLPLRGLLKFPPFSDLPMVSTCITRFCGIE